MPRAALAALGVLLIAALLPPRRARALDTPLAVINPWLSACDLEQPAEASDLLGACGAAPPPCPPACVNNATKTRNQCLDYLREAHKSVVCNANDPVGELNDLRLHHCCEHVAKTALSENALNDVRDKGSKCEHVVASLLEMDALAARISCELTEVLTRYDCGQPYSIVYHCDDCKEAYRRWVCSTLVPHFIDKGEQRRRVRPCLGVCQTVEQQCPYMLPGDRAPAHPTQYAGEPTFLCLDPNIPETGDQAMKSSLGTPDCCYAYCNDHEVCSNCDAAPGYNDTTWRVRCTAAGPPPSAVACNSGSSSSGAARARGARTVQINAVIISTSLAAIFLWTTNFSYNKQTQLIIKRIIKTFISNIIILHGLLLMFVNCVRRRRPRSGSPACGSSSPSASDSACGCCRTRGAAGRARTGAPLAVS